MTKPTESEYRKAHHTSSYFIQDKDIFVCSSGRWDVQSTGSCFGDPNTFGPTMILKKGGTTGIFFGTPIALSQAQAVCTHPSAHGPENDWVSLLPTADGLGTILVILNVYLENSKSKISYLPNPKGPKN